MGLSENRLNPIVPNGFADHYPYIQWLFHWEYTQLLSQLHSQYKPLLLVLLIIIPIIFSYLPIS